ncbi:hypothetical protein B0H15DRAFT_227431 [Mycena belliarum]|uniref:Uncharacterized protein n=1 Tax=Mycena belliarum TaxID=1033014 RepID=A0AAD6UMD5_9AGAR|nr:hypothetical protein B0H15DRAFT_227431 [Mycena belliae]
MQEYLRCVYLLFEAYPIVFTQGHHLSAGVSGLVFLPILLGGVTGVTTSILLFNPRYEREALRLAPAPVAPEYRLEMTSVAAPLYAIACYSFLLVRMVVHPVQFPLGPEYVLIFTYIIRRPLPTYLCKKKNAGWFSHGLRHQPKQPGHIAASMRHGHAFHSDALLPVALVGDGPIHNAAGGRISRSVPRTVGPGSCSDSMRSRAHGQPLSLNQV